jgi:hypothetical protein
VLCCAVLCCAVLCCAVLCCAVLCCAVLCCALSWLCFALIVPRCCAACDRPVGQMYRDGVPTPIHSQLPPGRPVSAMELEHVRGGGFRVPMSMSRRYVVVPVVHARPHSSRHCAVLCRAVAVVAAPARCRRWSPSLQRRAPLTRTRSQDTTGSASRWCCSAVLMVSSSSLLLHRRDAIMVCLAGLLRTTVPARQGSILPTDLLSIRRRTPVHPPHALMQGRPIEQ